MTSPDSAGGRPDIAAARARLEAAGLERGELDDDPLVGLAAWHRTARDLQLPEPDAMALATATADGRPSVRFVLLRGIDAGAIEFFTNFESRKGDELAANPYAAVVTAWYALGRQVRLEGPVTRTSDARADEYFGRRPRGSRLSAMASPQSRVVPDRASLETRRDELDALHPGDDLPRPSYWGGYRLVPDRIEFWQGRPDRLHDRFRYERDPASTTGWRVERLAP